MAKTGAVSKVEAQAQAWVRLLFDVSRAFSSSLELDDVLGQVLKMTVKIANASEGSIFLFNDEGHILRSIIARQELPPEVKTPVVETVMREGVAGWVFANKKPAIVKDTKDDERWKEFPDDRLLTRSAISVPILEGQQVRGIFTLTHGEPNAFSEDYINVLGPIAEQASIAIRNAVVYTKTRSEWVALQAILQAVREPVLVIDDQDQLTLFNKAAADELDLKKSDENKPLDKAIRDLRLREALASRENQQVTVADGRIFDCSVNEVLGMGRVATLHDVTVLNKLLELVNKWLG
jgi:GAF domain-containing protein